MTEDQQRAFQQLSAEQELVSSNIELVRQRMDLTQAYIRDMQMGVKTLEELKTKQPDEEILMNIGGGMVVRAKIADSEKVIRDIGSGVRIETTIDQAIERAKELISRLEKQYTSLVGELEKLTSHATSLDGQLRSLLSKVQTGK